MKKILQYSLYALMACGFVEVNASDVHQPEALSEVAPGQTASEQRLAEIKASLPSVVDAYDALLKSSADHPVTDANYAILCDFIMRLRGCSERDIYNVIGAFWEIEFDMRNLANQLIREQGGVPNGGIDSVITTWGGLPGKPIKEWVRLSEVLRCVSSLVGGLAYGNDCKIFVGGEDCRVCLDIASILSSKGIGMSDMFPQANCCFILKARHAFESDQDYISQIHKLNELYQSGASKRIKISIDGEESAKLLSEHLSLTDSAVVESLNIEGTERHLLHVTSVLLQTIRNIMRFTPNIESVWVYRAILEDGAAFCDFLRDYRVRKLELDYVDSSLLRHDADNIGPHLLGTVIKSFSDGGPAIPRADCVANARFWTTHLPQTIEDLYLYIYEYPDVYEDDEAVLEIFRTALERWPHMHTFTIEPAQITFDLRTIAYMVLHPSLDEYCLTEEKSLKKTIEYAEEAADDADAEANEYAEEATDADALTNVLMAFRKYCHILHNPYDHAGLLMGVLTRLKDFRSSLPSTNPAEDGAISKYFVEVTGQFRKAVEDKYDDFAGLDKDTLNNEFRQLVLRENLSLASRILRLSEDTIHQLLLNVEADNDTDITEPQLKRPKKD